MGGELQETKVVMVGFQILLISQKEKSVHLFKALVEETRLKTKPNQLY